MASRTRRRSSSPQARRAPAWLTDEAIGRIANLCRDPALPAVARRSPTQWTLAVTRLLEHAGGPVPADELQSPLDELVARFGIDRTALTMLRQGVGLALAKPAVDRFLQESELTAVPEAADDTAGAGGGAPSADDADAADRSLRELERLGSEVAKASQKAAEKDRKLREEREAHQRTRSELTSERDRALHRVAELERLLREGPTDATIAAAEAGRLEAERRSAAAEQAAARAAGEAREADAQAGRLRADLELAWIEAAEARADAEERAKEAERLRTAAPTPADLVRAAQSVGAAAVARLQAPEPGDAELIDAVAAVSRWSANREPRAGHGTAAAAAPPSPAEPSRAAAVAAPAAPVSPPRATPPAAVARRVAIARGAGLGSSAYLIQHAGRRILLDAGDGAAQHATALDIVVLTHAHADHLGGLARLLQEQPDLKVYCSKPTKRLALDQANAEGEHLPGERLLVRDAGEPYRILGGAVELTLHRVAHILGACAVRLRFSDGFTVVYSGDLGGALRTLRPDQPLPLDGADAILLESTMGDRAGERADWEGALLRSAGAVVAAGGAALFPVSAIGRPEELAVLFGAAMADGRIPVAPIRATPLVHKVLARYRAGDRDGWLSDAVYPDVELLAQDRDPGEVMDTPAYVLAGGSAALERRSGALAFAAAERSACGVFFTSHSGWAARGRGRGDRLEIRGDDGRHHQTTIRCRWEWFHSPDHADQDGLARAVAHADAATPILLVHGSDGARRVLAERLRREGHRDVRVPGEGEVVELAPARA